ncbi:unnamed protein product, partial [Pelagomonas calceolata]
MASASVPTLMVLSTKGTPKAEAKLKTGMMGNTSSLPQDQMSEGRYTTGRNLSEFSLSLASTARLATKYLRSHSGATLSSTKDPPATSGHPDSAHDTNANGVRGANGNRRRFAVASMALKAVCRVMRSYVLSAPGTELEPLTTFENCVKPESTSNNNPTACTTASASFTNCWTSFASAASPLIHSTQSKAASPGSGFSPLLLNEATSQPRSTARLQTSLPTYPDPPRTQRRLGGAADMLMCWRVRANAAGKRIKALTVMAQTYGGDGYVLLGHCMQFVRAVQCQNESLSWLFELVLSV